MGPTSGVPSCLDAEASPHTATLQDVAVVAIAEAKRHAAKVVRTLKKDYPDATCALNFDSPLQLLVATILSAQCTDKRVNLVTGDLFQKYKTAADFAHVRQATLERAVQSTGFFRNKAANIRACCKQIANQHSGQVPQEMETLVGLPGIGRKTANVVLGTAFAIPSGVVVDTHVSRIARRLGLTQHTDAVKIEKDLCRLLPRREWIDFSHRMIHHGRQVCSARNPKCDSCSMQNFCPRIGVETKPQKKKTLPRKRKSP